MSEQNVSGYDAETNICWQFRNKGDRDLDCKCPAHTRSLGERMLAYFGRCRSGSRWFWSANIFFEGNKEAFGLTDTEEEAMAAAMTTVCSFRTGVPILATAVHGWASLKLKELNKAKRLARPTPDTSNTCALEYLYARGHCSSEDGRCGCERLSGTDRWNYHLHKFQILKKTKQRIYYNRKPLPFEERLHEYGNIRDLTEYGTAFIDRQKIEQEGEIWSHKSGGWWEADCRLYLKPPAPRASSEPIPDLSALKAEMAAAHPDRGGSSAAFIEARTRYVEARRKARRTRVAEAVS